MNSFVSTFRAALSVGSSCMSRWSPAAIFSSSPAFLAWTANEITVFGSQSGSNSTGCSSEEMLFPTPVSFSFGTATMSPGPTSSTEICSFPLIRYRWPNRSGFFCVALRKELLARSVPA